MRTVRKDHLLASEEVGKEPAAATVEGQLEAVAFVQLQLKRLIPHRTHALQPRSLCQTL
jgi:hypothetical protein